MKTTEREKIENKRRVQWKTMKETERWGRKSKKK